MSIFENRCCNPLHLSSIAVVAMGLLLAGMAKAGLAPLSTVAAAASAPASAAVAAPSPKSKPASAPASAPDQPGHVATEHPPAMGASGTVVSTAKVPRAEHVKPAPMQANSPAQNQALARALTELALEMLRQPAVPPNAVVSPLSVSAALGLLQRGSGGQTAAELARLLDTTPRAGQRAFAQRLPAALAHIETDGQASGALTMANRVWVNQSAKLDLVPAYLQDITARYHADALALPMEPPEPARQTINQWVAQATAQRITSLLTPGALTPDTRVVLTNAVHFKSAWAKPFDPEYTAERAFATSQGKRVSAPTLLDERLVRQAQIGQTTVYELPFAGEAFALRIGLPPTDQPLAEFVGALDGADLADWGSTLQSRNCLLALPRLNLKASAMGLKPLLRALGVRSAFAPSANFSPMLGPSAAKVHLDEVFHSATLTLDEAGGEASAATAVTLRAKGLRPVPSPCAVDRAFVFALVHQASGLPLFVGKVADPTQP